MRAPPCPPTPIPVTLAPICAPPTRSCSPLGGRAVVGTGIAVAVPDGYAAFVHPRSGLAARHGVTVANAPGTVDAGYRGQVQVVLVNLDPVAAYMVRRGDRIAQLLIQPVVRARFAEAAELPPSERGEGGFGSSGT